MPRRTVAPASPCSRAFSTMARCSGFPCQWSLSPMKMRRRTASVPDSTSLSPPGAHQPVTGCEQHESAGQAQQHIQRGPDRFAITRELPALICERGERRHAAQQPDRQERPQLRPQRSPVLHQPEDDPKEKRAEEIDGERPVGKVNAKETIHPHRYQITQDGTNRAADRDRYYHSPNPFRANKKASTDAYSVEAISFSRFGAVSAERASSLGSSLPRTEPTVKDGPGPTGARPSARGKGASPLGLFSRDEEVLVDQPGREAADQADRVAAKVGPLAGDEVCAEHARQVHGATRQRERHQHSEQDNQPDGDPAGSPVALRVDEGAEVHDDQHEREDRLKDCAGERAHLPVER